MFNMNPAAVGISAATETGISIETAASTGASMPALTGQVPMANDLDSAMFAQVAVSSGAAYGAVATEHAAQRGAYSAAQSLSAAATEASEAMTAAANTLG
ncbi:MAG: PE family protein [Mycobacterium sp.]|nr:PE family protein [Mycobacterium sp.]